MPLLVSLYVGKDFVAVFPEREIRGNRDNPRPEEIGRNSPGKTYIFTCFDFTIITNAVGLRMNSSLSFKW